MSNIIPNEFTNERVDKLRTVSSPSGHSSRSSNELCTTIGCLRLVILVVLACIICLQSVPGAEGLAYPYNLMGVPPKKPLPPSTNTDNNGDDDDANQDKLVTTATNSPIYYINKLDLSSLFMNLLPGLHQHDQQSTNTQRRPASSTTTQNPLFEALVASALDEAKRNKSKTKTTKPFKRIPLPFVSNAKPVASYELTSTEDNIVTTDTPPTTTEPTKPWMNKYPPSKLIRLKTKFVANGNPSAVYVFKSPARRYFLQDLLRRPTAAAEADKRQNSQHRRKQPGHFRIPRKHPH